MNRITTFLKPGRIAAILFALALLASPEMSAQEDSPNRITFIVAKSVACDVAVEYTGGNVALLCSPGTTTYELGDIPAYIYNCHGVLVEVGNDGPCTFGIPIADGCCVDACISYDQQGRPVVTISRAECSCDND